MRAIEINSKTDKDGNLKITYPLDRSEKDVRVLILIDDYEIEDEEKLWIDSISKNTAFDFLKESDENIYSLTDGEPFND